MVEKDPQTLAKVKLWVSRSIAPTLAMCVEHPGGQAWLNQVLVLGKRRLKDTHRRLLNTSQHATRCTSQDERSDIHNVGGDADAPFQGGEGVS